MIYRTRRDELENQLNKGALWAVTYGDLMSYLMIFFLILFSFSISKSDKAKSRKYEESLVKIQKAFGGKVDTAQMERAKVREQEDSVAEKIKQSMENNQMSSLVQIDSNERRVRLVLTEAVLFDSGKAELKARAKEVLAPIVEELKKLPNDVLVEGHTDIVPIHKGLYATNWELSMARAYSVIQYLETLGMTPKRLAGIGYGDNRPVADNATPQGRALNRRIEISLLKTD
ncbi:MAG TPA: OmpA family protein [Elusimicrobiales bacterium]|nr:OmpA family protein [Elusimicrobiales bacterium]